jgi:Glycosyl hydrolases family 2, sugar binding domain/Glycosyl hydrolases family 2, TIM barrel domain
VSSARAADHPVAASRGVPDATAAYTAPNPRTRIDLNVGWRFVKGDISGAQASGFDDSAWAPVNTPHTWNAADGADGGNNYYRGVGWYRRHLTVPADLAGRMLFLQFAGVNQVADVWVNGVHLGQHKGGYSRFRLGATAALLPGKDNVIAVKVTNAPDPDIAPLSADYTFAGGIYRNVSLWAVNKLQVQILDYSGPGVYLRQNAVSAASATVTVRLWNNTSASTSVAVRTVIADADGNVAVDQTSAPRSLAAATGIPLVNGTTDSAAFTASTENQLYELIRQNYNHPSIAFWSIGNEQNSDNTPTNTLLAALARIVATEDPDRLSTYASDLGDTAGVGRHTEVRAWNKYYGWYGGSKNGDLGKWADSVHAGQPTLKFAVSEYGAGANTSQHALNPAAPAASGSWHPEEYQALFHEAAWYQIKARPYLWGTFVWNMFDFASDGRNEGSQPGINDKGLVTRDRAIRKDAFYFYKAGWSTVPTVHITSRRWTQRTDAATELKVYSNAPQITASLNGAPYTDTVTWALA